MLRAVSGWVAVPAGCGRILAASALVTGLAAGVPAVCAGSAVAAARPGPARAVVTTAAQGVSASGGTWGKAHQIRGLAALATDHASYADALSCASPGNCSAGGSYATHANGYGVEAFVVTQTRGVWGQAEEVPGSASLNAGDGGAYVASISCASAGNCSAGGEYTDSSGEGQAFAVSQANGVWGTAVEAPGRPRSIPVVAPRSTRCLVDRQGTAAPWDSTPTARLCRWTRYSRSMK